MIWSAGDKTDLDKFESEWSMKPVAVKGIFDHTREVKVSKVRNGEKGFDIVTPFYTHLDGKGQEQAILVNRGWIPKDFANLRQHYSSNTLGTVTGVLYRGDTRSKYSKLNTPSQNHFTSVQPNEIALITQAPN